MSTLGSLPALLDRDPALEAAIGRKSAVLAVPEPARALIEASADLYRRVARLDEAQGQDDVPASPARSMLGRLSQAF